MKKLFKIRDEYKYYAVINLKEPVGHWSHALPRESEIMKRQIYNMTRVPLLDTHIRKDMRRRS